MLFYVDMGYYNVLFSLGKGYFIVLSFFPIMVFHVDVGFPIVLYYVLMGNSGLCVLLYMYMLFVVDMGCVISCRHGLCYFM